MFNERIYEEEVKVVEVSINCSKNGDGCAGKMVYVPNTYEITGTINLKEWKERSTLDNINYKHRCNICNNEEYFEKIFPSIELKKEK